MNHWMKDTILSMVVAAGLGLGVGTAGAAPSGTFEFADQVKLVTMDPHQHSGGGLGYLRPVDGRIEPLLAAGYEIDGLNVEITLRDDVTLSTPNAELMELAEEGLQSTD
jgi:peptide/nickel transport system substrate-binding protein